MSLELKRIVSKLFQFCGWIHNSRVVFPKNLKVVRSLTRLKELKQNYTSQIWQFNLLKSLCSISFCKSGLLYWVHTLLSVKKPNRISVKIDSCSCNLFRTTEYLTSIYSFYNYSYCITTQKRKRHKGLTAISNA